MYVLRVSWLLNTYPMDTGRNDNVIITSKRRFGVIIMTLLLGHASVGYLHFVACFSFHMSCRDILSHECTVKQLCRTCYPWSWCQDNWGRVTHIWVRKLTIIGSDNGLSPGRRQAIIWTNAGMLLIGPVGTNFSEILIKIYAFSYKKMQLKMSSGNWRPFCLGLNVLTNWNQCKMMPFCKRHFRIHCLEWIF